MKKNLQEFIVDQIQNDMDQIFPSIMTNTEGVFP